MTRMTRIRHSCILIAAIAAIHGFLHGLLADDINTPHLVIEARKTVSREGAEFLERLKKGTPFGTNNFDLNGLRAGMGGA